MLLNNRIIKLLFIALVPVVMVVYYLIMRGININIILLLIYAVLGLVGISIGFKHASNKFVCSMNMFLFYCLISIIFYLFNGLPISCYINTLRSFLFPIIFAYLGYEFSSDYNFNRWYLIGCAFCFLVGFYLYITMPPYYLQFLADARSNTWYINDSGKDEEYILEMTRFSSFFTTSYAISCLSIPSLVLSLSFSLKGHTVMNKGWCYFLALISFIAAILCQQRISIAYSVLCLSFFIFYSPQITKKKNNMGLILLIVFVTILVVSIFDMIAHLDWVERIYNLVKMRIDEMSFSKAMSERTSQYSSFNRATDLSYIFGLGLGSCGHAAGAAGFQSINDGEYIKLFYEFGIVGCVLLIIVIMPTLLRGLKYFKFFYAEVLIIIFYLISGIAADSLTFFIFSIMFWYSLGRIWNNKYFERLKNEFLEKSYGN